VLEQYRALSEAAERFETQSHYLEGEGSNLRLEILARDGEMRRLRDRVDQSERQIQEVSPIPTNHDAYDTINPFRQI